MPQGQGVEHEEEIYHLIHQYFHYDLRYQDIVKVLFLNHGIEMSTRQLKRHLKKLNLTRRKIFSSAQSVFNFVYNQLETSGQSHGYRWMHQKCKMNGFKVKRENIRLLIQVVDPHGVDIRSRRRLKRRDYWSKGPNFCWHYVDSYDKLKKYGLCINGCIDGYSRKIIWLKVGRTNNDPTVIGRYYLDAVNVHGGSPLFMRGDMGTENVLIAALQNLFSRNDTLEHNQFIFGKSSFNTRIESWWGILRKECCQTWMEELKDLQNRGLFTGDKLDTNLLQFCFMALLQTELDEVARVWNTHYMQSKKTAEGSVRGRPSNVYLFPELFQVQDYIHPIDGEVLELCKHECTIEHVLPCDEEIFKLGCIFMEEYDLEPPSNIYEGKAIYIDFRSWIMNVM